MDPSNNILKKIYPKPHLNDYSNLSYDVEGLYSITHPTEANIISTNIIKMLNMNKSKIDNDYKILDMTAGCGGNMISFCAHFKYAVGVENNITRYTILEKNMLSYNYTNYKLICGDSLQMIDSTFDVFFIDPPWGGPEYKKNVKVELTISNLTLVELIEMIPCNKLIVLKLPYNYNISTFSKYILLSKIEIKNILVLFLIRLEIS